MEKKDNYEPKKCVACGNEFGCGANAAACWCAKVSLEEDRTALLRSKFSDCICPNCLTDKNAVVL